MNSRLLQVLVMLWLVTAVCVMGQEVNVAAGAQKTWSVGTPAVALSLGVGAGHMSYEESFSIVDYDSEWDAGFVALDGQMRIDDASGWVLQIGGSVWMSGEGEEEWSSSSGIVQQNDMEVGTAEFLAEVGYVLFRDAGVTVLPLLGAGARRQEFDRTDARVFGGDFEEWDKAEEDVDIGFINLALEIDQELSTDLSLAGRLDLGVVTRNEAYNSLLNADIEGDGGIIFGASLGAGWSIDDRNSLSLSFNYEMQDLQGGTREVLGFDPAFNLVTYELEWPDNETERMWGELTYRHQF